jgi:Methyltransferase domain
MLRRAVRRAANTMGFDICRISKPLFPVRMAIPPLLQEHVDGAVLYAERTKALEALPRGGVVAEIGVGLGDFSEAMLAHLAPRRFDAFDLFKWHETESFWGRSSADWFGGLSHRAQYERRFAEEIAAGKLHIHEGNSSLEMDKQPDSTYDVIYIDGDHSYEGVMRDAEASVRKLKSNGILIFNDYIIFDHVLGVPYGVVPVVHEFCVNRGWQVIFFALQNHLFCDIALRRMGERQKPFRPPPKR